MASWFVCPLDGNVVADREVHQQWHDTHPEPAPDSEPDPDQEAPA